MSSPQQLRLARATGIFLALAGTIAVSPVPAQQAPTGLQVTGTAASATVTWQPVKGALSYSVWRWKQGDPRCCNNSVKGLAQPTWTDEGAAREGFTQPGVYVFKVTAHFGGASAGTVTNWTLPAESRLADVRAPTGLRPAPVTVEPRNEPAPVTAPVTSPTALPIEMTATLVPALMTAAAAPPPAPAPPVAVAPQPTIGPTPAPASTARFTSLKPGPQGFRFINTFKNSFIGPPFSVYTSGLCGGMSYAVLDYYNAGLPIPTQDYRPANNTTIQHYLYGRQVPSLTENLDKWAETSFNPFGSRTLEFFNWGLSGRLQELRSFIDRGVPVPLGLKGTGAGLDHDHQVLAIGYDLGRYKGDLGAYKEDFKIYLLDPNYPNQIVTLVPNPAALDYSEVEHPTNHWRTYFVDGKYRSMTPPNVVTPVYPNDGLTRELLLEVNTGQDDMRGGADHVDLTIRLANGTTQFYPNISQDGIWLPTYLETVQVILTQPVPAAMIKTLEISTNATGGLNGDNWDLVTVQAYAVGGGFKQTLLSSRAGPYRFTGARIPFVIDVK